LGADAQSAGPCDSKKTEVARKGSEFALLRETFFGRTWLLFHSVLKFECIAF
jgi:hypothetical protein